MTKTKPFLMKYFYSMTTPTNIFKGRKYLGWMKMLLIFVFLMACLLVPTSISLSRMTSFHFGYLMPGVSQLINDDFAAKLSTYEIANGILEGDNQGFAFEQEEGLLAIDLSGKYKIEGSNQHYQVEGFNNAVVFMEDAVIVSDENGFGFRLLYPTSDRYPFQVNNAEDVLSYIGTIWYSQNKMSIFPIVMALIAGILLMINVLQFVFMSFVLWLTKKSKVTHISTFKESANLVLNAIGIPTILATIYGFYQFDIITMLMIQSLGTVLMIAFTFFRTRFQEI